MDRAIHFSQLHAQNHRKQNSGNTEAASFSLVITPYFRFGVVDLTLQISELCLLFQFSVLLAVCILDITMTLLTCVLKVISKPTDTTSLGEDHSEI